MCIVVSCDLAVKFPTLNQRMKSHCASRRIAAECPDVDFLYPNDGWSIFAAILGSVVPAVLTSKANRTLTSSHLENETILED